MPDCDLQLIHQFGHPLGRRKKAPATEVDEGAAQFLLENDHQRERQKEGHAFDQSTFEKMGEQIYGHQCQHACQCATAAAFAEVTIPKRKKCGDDDKLDQRFPVVGQVILHSGYYSTAESVYLEWVTVSLPRRR